MILSLASSNETLDYDSSIESESDQFLTLFIFHLESSILGFWSYILNTVEHFILGCLLYLALCVILYICAMLNLISFNRDIRNAKRILFIIAHPDDEVMFFGPTILHYTEKANCLVYLMCLSSGKNYGMDRIRTNELYDSCKLLGVKEENIFVYNNTNLPDAMDVSWPVEIISKSVQYMVEAFNITNIITFDRNGVSGHQNHCSIYYAVASLILDEELPKTCGVYVLETVNIVRKYWLFLDIPVSFIMSRFRYMGGYLQRRRVQHALCEHTSQIVWFRSLYMNCSRYLLINTLQQMNLVDIELDLELED